MRKKKDLLTNIVFLGAFLSTGAILFNLAAVHIFRDQVFIDRAIFAPIEYVILFGFAFVFFFVILSLVWLFNSTRVSGRFAIGNSLLLVFGLFCLVTFLGQKVMADEIGRELRLGWEVIGELIILSLLFVIQLVYSVLILFKVIPQKVNKY